MVYSFANRMILVLTFVQCVQLSSQNYIHRLYIDNDKSYHLSWKFDEQEIEFEVLVNTTGYVGFGLSLDGTMTHSDVVIGEVKNGQHSLKDYHGFANGTLVEDSAQNWILISADQMNNQTKLIFKRKLITNDANDMDITDDTMRVIWAYGDEEFNKDNFTIGGYKSLYLLQIKRPEISIPDNATKLLLAVNQTLIPNHTTTYWCKRIQAPAFKEKMHVIKISPVITKGNELFVHHILLYHCRTVKPVLKDEKGHVCHAKNMPEYWETCSSVMFGWAIGGSVFTLPEHVGLLLGDTAEQRVFILEIHYDNPEGESGVLDSSGFELIMIPAARDFDGGVLEIGQAPVVLGSPMVQKIPPYQQTFRYQGLCSSNCIYDAFPPKNKSVIKMFAATLHGHLLAKQIVVHHFRNGHRIGIISADRNYDFNYQEAVFFKKEIEFLPGDDLKIECVYNSMSRSKFTWGGLATRDEMCLVFIMYYPKVKTTHCLSGIEIQDTTWLENSLKADNVVQFQKKNISEEFEMTVNGLGRKSSFFSICSDGRNPIIKTKNPMDVYNLLQFQKTGATDSPITTTGTGATDSPITTTGVTSKAGIGAWNVFGLSSMRSLFLAAVLLYLVIP